jgi:hypothetical protein
VTGVDNPTAFLVFTVKIYGTPFVRPVKVAVAAVTFCGAIVVSEHVTRYPVIGLPPVLRGAVQLIVHVCDVPTVITTEVGGPGTSGI